MIKQYVPGRNPSDLVEKIKADFNYVDVLVDEELTFYCHHISLIESNENVYYIRFMPNAVRIPSGKVMPWIENSNFGYREEKGTIRIPSMLVTDVESFPCESALFKDYSSKEEILAQIQKDYNCMLKPTDLLSGYLLGKIKQPDFQLFSPILGSVPVKRPLGRRNRRYFF